MNENHPQNKERLDVRIFDAKGLGKSLKEVSVEHIKVESQDVESRWFHSNKDADLFIWKDARKNLLKLQVSFYGNLVEWNIIEGARTGYILEDDTKPNVAGSATIQFDSKPQRHTIEQGVDIISHIEGLSQQDKWQIIENFTHSPFFDALSPAEIMKRFGLTDVKPKSIWLWLFKLLGLDKKPK